MRRRVKDGLREARLKVRASRADVASDLAYRLVPARIDVDVGTDCEDARAKRASDASTSDASSSVRLVAHYGLDHTASTVSYAEEQRLLVTTIGAWPAARGGEDWSVCTRSRAVRGRKGRVDGTFEARRACTGAVWTVTSTCGTRRISARWRPASSTADRARWSA